MNSNSSGIVDENETKTVKTQERRLTKEEKLVAVPHTETHSQKRKFDEIASSLNNENREKKRHKSSRDEQQNEKKKKNKKKRNKTQENKHQIDQ
jgi:hypothetical protein